MASVALAATGLVGGAILGSTLTAGAATTAASTPSTNGSTSGSAPSGSAAGGPFDANGWGSGGPGYRALGLSGTVTAVGTSNVTIKTSSATTTYAVTASSDIDKNGESTLSKLVVGDAVTFDVTSAATPTIDKLHAGSESLDRPSGPGPNGYGFGYGPGGGQPSGATAAG